MYQGDPLRAQVSFMKNMFLSYMDRPYFRHYMIEEEYATRSRGLNHTIKYNVLFLHSSVQQ